jgi:hypothetical protein
MPTQNEIYAERHAKRLEAKVRAKNRLNALILELMPKILVAAAPFVGKRVSTPAAWEKFKNALPKHADLIITQSNWNVQAFFKVCESAGDGCCYAEETVYFGDFQRVQNGVIAGVNGNLDKLNEWSPSPVYYRTDFTVAEIKERREAYKKAKAAADDAQSKLNFWGEYDN